MRDAVHPTRQTPESPTAHAAFRADIEGLRAVAILLVVAAHAHVARLAGGFVGVDVFFVLSGYLITRLLVREAMATGSVRLLAFYARRLQRLMPALLLTIVATAIGAMILLAPFEQVPQAQAAGAAASWTSNVYFTFADVDYFNADAASNLFLHTWSLGVEEQFYLVWPALVLFLLGALAWQGRRLDVTQLRAGMLATFALCLALSLLLTRAAPLLAFYMMVSRAWQFALGGLVFLLIDQGSGARAMLRSPRIAGLVGATGLVAIIATATLLDVHAPYPGWRALLPSLGAACVIAAGVSGVHGANRVLATRPLQGIGRVSYAWYLWHWPVFLLGATLVDVANPLHRLGLVAAALVLAVVSTRLFEEPLRRLAALRARPGWVVAGGLALIVASVAGAFAWKQAAERWSGEPAQRRYQDVRADLPALYALGCDDWYHSAAVKPCGFGAPDARHTVVLFGDSVGAQWFPAIERLFHRPDWRLVVVTKSSCPLVDLPFFYERIGREYVECAAWRRDAIAWLQTLRPDLILAGSSAAYPFSPDDWARGSTPVFAELARASAHVGILAPTPELPFDGPACLARQDWRARVLPGMDTCRAPAHTPQQDALRRALADAVQPNANVRLVDMGDAVCPDGICSARRGAEVTFRDGQHLRAGFVAGLEPALAKALRGNGLVAPGF